MKNVQDVTLVKVRECRVEWGATVSRDEDDARTDVYEEEAIALLGAAFPNAEIDYEIDRRTSGGSRKVTVWRGVDTDGVPNEGDWRDEDAVRDVLTLAYERACESKIDTPGGGVEVILESANGPKVIAPKDLDAEAIEAALPVGWTVGENWALGVDVAGGRVSFPLVREVPTCGHVASDSTTTDVQFAQAGPKLIGYDSNETIRVASASEAYESARSARRDGGAGVIRVDGVRSYVEAHAITDPRMIAMRDSAGAAGDFVAALVCGYALTGAWNSEVFACIPEQGRHDLERLGIDADRTKARALVGEWIADATARKGGAA